MKINITIDKKNIDKILKTLIVKIDSREKKNQHITDYFNKKKIPYISEKMDFGDYSFILPKNEELGIIYDIDFSKLFVIERKQHLVELSGNFTQKRTQFENELLRKKDARFILLIENNDYSDLIGHNYKTDYNERSFIASLKTFEFRYNISTVFMKKIAYTGDFIYHSAYYFGREFLKG